MNPTYCYDLFESNESPMMLRVEIGENWAFPLAQLLHVYQSEEKLTASFATHDVQIQGEKLELLYRAMAKHRVAVVRVGESSDGVVIRSMKVVPLGEGDET